MSVLLTASLSATLPLSAASHVDVVKMRTENRVNPLGIGTSTPRFSWQITSDRKGVVQTSYQILVASSKEKLDRNEADLWDSGERNSDEQLWIPYQGKVLLSGAQAYWKVRITTNKGNRNGLNRSSFPSDCSVKPNGAAPGLAWKTCSRENRKACTPDWRHAISARTLRQKAR